ncbi:MAG: type 4a pilus biogenesis protein PilO [Gammaproteobacteria bacterium]|nr:type 4a pilus biogenesis protein PilO [Gammaproteobacteria bacterium]
MEISLFTDLQNIDSDNPGTWPKSVKIFMTIVVIIFTLGLGWYVFVDDELIALKNAEDEEQKLRTSFASKQRLAASLPAYRLQLAEMEVQLATMLKKLPAGHETPGLLDDITFVATAAGLSIASITWSDEIEKEFYTELPLDINVEGDYHQFGKFVASVADLPRIVSLHDFTISTIKTGGLQLKIVAKTYRYKEDSQ